MYETVARARFHEKIVKKGNALSIVAWSPPRLCGFAAGYDKTHLARLRAAKRSDHSVMPRRSWQAGCSWRLLNASVTATRIEELGCRSYTEALAQRQLASRFREVKKWPR